MAIPLALDGLIWLVLLGFTIRACFILKDRRLAVLLLPAAALLAALIIGSGNYGTMERLRVQSAFLMVPVAVAGFLLPERSAIRRSRHTTAHTKSYSKTS